jgi:hypothetical protein
MVRSRVRSGVEPGAAGPRIERLGVAPSLTS